MSGIVTSNILDSTGLIKASSVAVGLTFISKQTASSSSTINFTTGIDSTYKEYIFYFNNLHPNSNSEPDILINFSSDGGSNYNVTKTTTSFYARHAENDDFKSLAYDTSQDLAQSTSGQYIGFNMEGADADGSLSGYLHLFNPSDDTFVTHFIANVSYMHDYPASWNQMFAGYCNTNSPINAVRFTGEHSEGQASTIDSGDISLYGLTKWQE